VWLEAENYRLGVDVRLSSYLDEDDVLAISPDIVIVATGASPRLDGIQASNPGEPMLGVERPTVISTNQLFSDLRRDWGHDAVVVDDVGHYEGIAAAEQLLSCGLAVTYVTSQTSFAPRVASALMPEPALERLSRGSFTLKLRRRAIAYVDRSVIFGPTYLPTANQRESAPADVVVFVSPNRPNRELYTALTGKVGGLHIVGDANSPRFLETAVREGHFAAVAIT
jgi:hypothetical protein